MLLGSALLLGCSTYRPPPQAASPPGKPPSFTVDTPIEVIAADPRGKQVLMQDVPGVMSNPKYPLFSDMSLAQIAIFARGKLPKDKLDEVQSDLDKLGLSPATR